MDGTGAQLLGKMGPSGGGGPRQEVFGEMSLNSLSA